MIGVLIRATEVRHMKIRIFFAISLTLALFTAAHAQTLDKAKLDQFFDRLAEKNKAMGSLTIAKDGNVLYTRSIGYGQINGTEKKPLTMAIEISDRFDHKNVHRRDDPAACRRRKIEADRYRSTNSSRRSRTPRKLPSRTSSGIAAVSMTPY